VIRLWAAMMLAGWCASAGEGDAAARQHFLTGQVYYDRADYVSAAREFDEAYHLSPRPELLYNLAQCYERLAQYPEAIAAYRGYIDAKPRASDRAILEIRIQNLQRLQAQRAGTAEVKSAPDARPLVRRPWFWLVVGAGAVVLVTAVAVGAVAGSPERDPAPTLGTVRGP
jgi:tetratricopeptide (TPR) repeat protein